MKIIDLAKQLGVNYSTILQFLKDKGELYTHHMNNIPDDLTKCVFDFFTKKCNNDRELYGINKNNRFSVIVFEYSGGNFNEKLENIAKSLGVRYEDLISSMKITGYPLLKEEIFKDTETKALSTIECKKIMNKRSIFKRE